MGDATYPDGKNSLRLQTALVLRRGGNGAVATGGTSNTARAPDLAVLVDMQPDVAGTAEPNHLKGLRVVGVVHLNAGFPIGTGARP